jgi:hypothetical protein
MTTRTLVEESRQAGSHPQQLWIVIEQEVELEAWRQVQSGGQKKESEM